MIPYLLLLLKYILKRGICHLDCVVSAIQFLLMHENRHLEIKSGILLKADGLKFSIWSGSNLKQTW